MKVIVLGAGASKPAGLPLGSELAAAVRAWVESDRPVLEIWEALEREGIFGDTGDLELDLTKLDLELIRREKNGESLALRSGDQVLPFGSYRWSILPEAVEGLLLSLQVKALNEPEGLEYLRRFLKRHVEPGDVVITFNYDCLIETVLHQLGMWELRDGYGIDLAEDHSKLGESRASSLVQVLKLHGSAGWFCTVFQQRLLISSKAAEAMGYAGVTSNAREGVTRVAILPSYIKSFSRYPLPVIWRKAGQAIAAAESVAFVGYSFPEADSAARVLFLTHCPSEQPVRFFWRSEGTRGRLEALVNQFQCAGLDFLDQKGTIEELAERPDLSGDWYRGDPEVARGN